LKKILFLRFSSIGDIVLTFPVVRAVSEQIPNVEIHYATKNKFVELLSGCPCIFRIHSFTKSTSEIRAELLKENFECIIDLHNNLRSVSLSAYLNIKTYRYPKLNLQKWLLVNFKWNILRESHVVDRYFESVKKLHVKNPRQNNTFHIPPEAEIRLEDWGVRVKSFIAIALGAQFQTKQFPFDKLTRLIDKLRDPIVLLGGENEVKLGHRIIDQFPNRKIVNFSGELSILQSAFVVKHAAILVTNDSGLMHIASCFDTPIHLIWGNTVRAFGMFSYRPEHPKLTTDYEVNLPCRPCSKIGFSSCPKGHHLCMMNIDENKIASGIAKDLSDK